jgi:hypothetical protein
VLHKRFYVDTYGKQQNTGGKTYLSGFAHRGPRGKAGNIGKHDRAIWKEIGNGFGFELNFMNTIYQGEEKDE